MTEYYIAIFKGIKRTLPKSKWAKLTGKSTTFLTAKLIEAELKDILAKDRMQYAIDQIGGERTKKNIAECARAKGNPRMTDTDKRKLEGTLTRLKHGLICKMGGGV